MNLRQVRQKIKSIGNVKKITRAMQMVAAVKMKKAQDRAKKRMLYREYLKRMINALSQRVDKSYSPLFQSKTTKDSKIIILISSNKGLCGSFNSNLFKFLYKKTEIKKADYITLGKKGASFITSLGGKIISDFSNTNFLVAVSAVYTMVLEKFLKGEVKEIYLAYNKFISSFKFEPTLEKLLPIEAELETPKEENHSLKQYLIEPSPKEFLDALLNSFVEDRIRAAIMNSEAGEHSARMIAMKNATDNAGDLIYYLTLLRNKLRQEKITYELLDMITAKESVEVIN